MSRSPRRANAQARAKATIGRDGALRRSSIAKWCLYLCAAFEKESVQQQQYHGADN